MKKTLLLIALFISLTSYSQSNISKFVEYKITGFGSIKIPPTMELRTEKNNKNTISIKYFDRNRSHKVF